MKEDLTENEEEIRVVECFVRYPRYHPPTADGVQVIDEISDKRFIRVPLSSIRTIEEHELMMKQRKIDEA